MLENFFVGSDTAFLLLTRPDNSLVSEISNRDLENMTKFSA